MALVAAKCSGCGADIQVPSDRDRANCMYCGVQVIVRDAIELHKGSGPDPKNLLELASVAYDGSRYEEAYNLTGRALEANPSNGDAWLLRAKAILNMASLKDDRGNELKTACSKAIECKENPSDDDYEAAVNLLIEHSKNICLSGYQLVKNYGGEKNEYGVTKLNQDIWNSYQGNLAAVVGMLQTVKDLVDKGMSEDDPKFITSVVDICEAIVFDITDFILKMTAGHIQTNEGKVLATLDSRVVMAATEVHDYFRQLLVDCQNERIPETGAEIYNKAIDSVSTQQAQNKSSGCFVATAVYGTPDAEQIEYLRFFRDTALEKCTVGRAFIRWYYKYGQIAANYISTKPNIKMLVRSIIVEPAVYLCRRYYSKKTQ